jgi:hypothetical protein
VAQSGVGYPLGKHAAWLRNQWRDDYPGQLKELNEMQFAWNWSQYKWDHHGLLRSQWRPPVA